MLHDWIFLLGAGFMTGVINSVAGGGSFITFPALLALGLPPIVANATTSIVVQPGTISSAYGYKHYLRSLPKRYLWLVIPCVVGSFLGAILLTKTSNSFFGYLAPIFLLFAVVLLAFQPRIHKELFTSKGLALQQKHPVILMCVSAILFFVLAIYGGYFGAGFGIVALGLLGLTGIKNINQMNGLKNILGLSVGSADIIYILHHLINWQIVPLMIVGNIIGGYLGAIYISRLPEKIIRTIIIIIGVVVTAVLFFQFY